MGLTLTTNPGSTILRWKSNGLLSIVGYVYVQQLLWQWLLLIYGKYFVMGLIEITTNFLLISDNSQKKFLSIVSMIIFQLIPGLWKITHLSLMRSMTDRQFLISVPFVFPVLLLVTQRSELFLTSLSTLLHSQTLL